MINLFVNYYQASTEERQDEIDFCYNKNLNNSSIDNIICFTNSMIPGNQDSKTIVIDIERPTYQDFFDAAKDYPNDINIIANSDIFFNETLEHVKGIKDDEIYCLTRWEWNDGNIIDFNRMHNCPHCWSQDAWIWKGANRAKGLDKVIAVNLQNNNYDEISYTTGIPGCENHLAWLMKNQFAYNVSNPSKSIRAIHVHKDQSRPKYSHRITGTKTGGTWGRLMKVPQI